MNPVLPLSQEVINGIAELLGSFASAILVSLLCENYIPLFFSGNLRSYNKKVHNQSLISKWSRITRLIMGCAFVVTVGDLLLAIAFKDCDTASEGTFVYLPMAMIVASSFCISFRLSKKNKWWKYFEQEKARVLTVAVIALASIIALEFFLGTMMVVLDILSKDISLQTITFAMWIILILFVVCAAILEGFLYLFAWDKRENKYNRARIYPLRGKPFLTNFSKCYRKGDCVVIETDDEGKGSTRIEFERSAIKRIEYSKE